MATFISLINFTEKGVEQIANTTKRAKTFRSQAKKLGVKVKDVYWTLGAYDGVLVFEASDDETATASMLRLGIEGNVRTSTLRAFSAQEMENIIQKTSG